MPKQRIVKAPTRPEFVRWALGQSFAGMTPAESVQTIIHAPGLHTAAEAAGAVYWLTPRIHPAASVQTLGAQTLAIDAGWRFLWMVENLGEDDLSALLVRTNTPRRGGLDYCHRKWRETLVWHRWPTDIPAWYPLANAPESVWNMRRGTLS